MSLLQQVGLVALIVGIISPQEWVGQGRVHPPNGFVPDGAPSIAADAYGTPWVVWDTRDTVRLGDTTQVFSLRQRDTWSQVRGVGPNLPGVLRRLNSSVVSDGYDRVWLVWHDAYEDNNRDIGSSYWIDTCWSPEIQVNLPDSTELDFRPKVACGGGKVWCVWFGGPTDYPPLYKIYASRWNEELGQWEPEMEVSEQGNWFPDVAVDTLGRPHIVWCSVSKYAVYYSYFDGDSWSHPVIIHDTTRLTASPRACPRIEIDREGMLHTCFTGAYRGASHRDIFYTRNDGSGWDTCQLVTRDAVYDEWYSDIAADRPDNVWIVWDRQGEGPDQFRVYASRYDGEEWSPEERLDDDTTSYYDGCPAICLDNQCLPWVVWSGMSYSSQQFDVFYNWFSSVGVCERENEGTSRDIALKLTSCHSSVPIKVIFELSAPSPVHLVVVDAIGRRIATLIQEKMVGGIHTVFWTSNVPAGIYFIRLKAGKFQVSRKVILTGR